MNNTYDRDGGPWWSEVILDRIDHHRLAQHNAKLLEDYDSADAHAIALEELMFLCGALGVDAVNS